MDTLADALAVSLHYRHGMDARLHGNHISS